MGYMKEFLLAQREYDNRLPPEYWQDDEVDEDPRLNERRTKQPRQKGGITAKNAKTFKE